MTAQEQSRLDYYINDSYTEEIYHIKINPIGDFLKGNELDVKLPGTQTIVKFKASYIKSTTEDDYYWLGYNGGGSSFELMKMPVPNSGGLQQPFGSSSYAYLGNIQIPSSDFSYQIVDLSPQRSICIKFKRKKYENENICTVTGDDEDEEYIVEDRSNCPHNNIRVLFLFTGATTINNIPTIVANNILNQLNASILASGLTPNQINFESAGVETLTFVETPDIGNDLDRLVNNTTAHNLRDDNFADMVILLTAAAYPDAAGRAKGTATKNKNTYCIAEIPTAVSGLTGVHEIGHLIGARHQRCSECQIDGIFSGCNIFTNHHGFRIDPANRSIMFQNGCDATRTRIGQWTNLENGTGTEVDDNSKILVKRAAKIACFRDDPPAPTGNVSSVVITSSSPTLCRNGNAGIYYGSFNQSNLTYPLTYTWAISPNGISGFTTVSSNPNGGFYSLNPTSLSSSYTNAVFIRLTVTDALGASGHVIYEVELVDCLSEEVDNRNSLSIEGNSDKIIIYPNPVIDRLQIKGIENEDIVFIYDTNGQLVLKQQYVLQQSINTSTLTAGLYIVKIQSQQQIKTLKFCKL